MAAVVEKKEKEENCLKLFSFAAIVLLGGPFKGRKLLIEEAARPHGAILYAYRFPPNSLPPLKSYLSHILNPNLPFNFSGKTSNRHQMKAFHFPNSRTSFSPRDVLCVSHRCVLKPIDTKHNGRMGASPESERFNNLIA